MTGLGALGFTYDTSDQPRTVSGTATGTYAYDGHMRRVKSVVGGVTRYSVYDAGGGLVSIDQTGVGGGNTEYIRASGMTLARVVGASVTWLHHDHLGSAVAGTNASGAVVWRESEQPFGEDWVSAAANDNQAGYTGHVEDAATGLTYMQARYYDPIIGRFLSIDPVGFTPGRPSMFNRYAYAGNDPVNMLDPTGLSYECNDTTLPNGAAPCRAVGEQILDPAKPPVVKEKRESSDFQRQTSKRDAKRNKDQHEEAVSFHMKQDLLKGFKVEPGRAVTFPDGRVRIYDYMVVDPLGQRFGIEVKSSRTNLLRLKSCQIECDVELIDSKGMLDSQGLLVSGVGYRGALFGPGDFHSARISSLKLHHELKSRGVEVLKEPMPGVFTDGP